MHFRGSALTVVAVAASHLCSSVSGLPCPNLCNQHGSCDLVDRECQCHSGYEGADCSRRVCPTGKSWADIAAGTDNAHNTATCSDMGLCDYITGTCECFDGFEGDACQRSKCKDNCNHHGQCVNMNRMARFYDVEYNQWDATKIYGCKCDDGYSGYDCSLKVCPVGDDPLTVDQVNEKQLLMVTLPFGATASASDWFTLSFNGWTTQRIYAYDSEDTLKTRLENLPSLREVTVTFLDTANAQVAGYATNDTSCTYSDAQFISVEFLQDFGDLPPLRVKEANGKLKVPASCAEVKTACVTENLYYECDYENFIGQLLDDMDYDVQAVMGTKESVYCSNRGICDEETGLCDCSYNFESSDGNGEYATAGIRGDCGYKAGPVVACPGEEVECSGHGVCSGDPTYVCSCLEGWTAADCSLRTCPTGTNWFDLAVADNIAHQESECSNNGICDRDYGTCECNDGFVGEACDRMSCSRVMSRDLVYGEEWMESGVECNGKGTCLSMRDLALYGDVNGVVQDYTYGATPNDEATWDFDVIYGCLCDEGFEGPDCSQRSCPTGDNPDSEGVPEIQTVTCQHLKNRNNTVTSDMEYDPTVSFTLTFRSEISASLSFNASAADIEEALEALSGIDQVVVEFDDTTEFACASPDSDADDPQYSTWSVTFYEPTGDLPDLVMAENFMFSAEEDPGLNFTVTTTQDATTEDAVCSERGVCDYMTGQCACFTGWGSSDGQGAQGDREDCGWRIPTYGNTYLSQHTMDDDERLQEQMQQMGSRLSEKYGIVIN